MIALRPFQVAAKDELRAGFRAGHLRQLLVAPTGSGKSVIAHDLVEGALSRQTRVLFTVNRIQLVEQFSRRLFEAGVDHGIMQGDNTRSLYARCIVGSIQTIARRGAPVGTGLVISDEAHGCAGSSDYEELFCALQNVPVIGLTATPWARGLGRHVDGLRGKLFERLVAAASYSELIAQGYLVDCDVYAPSAPDMTGARLQNGPDGPDWSDTVAAERSNQPKLVGDIVAHWKRLAAGTPTVAFGCTIEHSKSIADAFNRDGIAAEHIDAYTKPADRAAILRRVDEGRTMIVSCVSLLAEGWDQPSIRTMILARPTRSLIRYIQMAGRILRPFPGKDISMLLDHSGSALRLGNPTEDREYTLDDGSPKEQNQDQDEEQAPKIQKCPKCDFLPAMRWRVCPKCGHERATQVKSLAEGDGKLVKMERFQREVKQSWWSMLLGYASSNGKSQGWASHSYKAKFGVWPRTLADVPHAPNAEVLGYIKHRNIAYAKSQQRRAA